MLRRLALTLLPALALWAAVPAWATVITGPGAIANPQVITFSQFNAVTVLGTDLDPVQIGQLVGEDVTMTSSNDGYVLGTNASSLGANGNWTGSTGSAPNAYAGIHRPQGSLLFAFPRGLSGVGAFVNFNPDTGDGVFSIISVYNDVGSFIESLTLDFSTPGGVNAGRFLGFTSALSNIHFFQLEGNAALLDNLTFSGLAAPGLPEAPSLALALLALLLLGYTSGALRPSVLMARITAGRASTRWR